MGNVMHLSKGLTLKSPIIINEEIKRVEAQVVAQGGTLEAALSAQGMTMDDLKKRIIFQKEIEGIVIDKITITEQEVAQYIVDNKITVPAGQEATINEQIKTEIKNQKLKCIYLCSGGNFHL
jgi:hypothetical protein